MIHIYYGRGKGKTSAALGAALRAAGQGWKVLVVQFMKDAGAPSGEVGALARLGPLVTLMRAELPYAIARPGPKALAVLRERTSALFTRAARLVRSGRYRLAVLDELGVALSRRWLGLEAVLSMLDALPPGCEVIVTGRTMPRKILERGALVTRMVKVRHPYDRGLKARRGVEF